MLPASSRELISHRDYANFIFEKKIVLVRLDTLRDADLLLICCILSGFNFSDSKTSVQ